jgi:hypothetical protein
VNFYYEISSATMSDAAVSPAKKPEKVKAAKAKKPASTKKAAEHPKYADIVAAAIGALKERGGSSRQAIVKYALANYKVKDNANTHIKQALKKGVTGGTLKQVKGTGASGSFKLAEKVAKKKVAKKPKAKKVVKKPAAKKAKKPAAKKAKKPAAKKAVKKPAAKKTPAKKPAAKVVKKVVKKKTPKKKASKAAPKKK